MVGGTGGSSTVSITNEEPLQFKDSSREQVMTGSEFQAMMNNSESERNINENVTGADTKNEIVAEQLLDEDCRDLIKAELVRLHEQMTQLDDKDRQRYIAQVDLLVGRNYGLEGKYERVAQKAYAAGLHRINEELCRQHVALCRAAGSSRNSYVLRQFNEAVESAVVNLEALVADIRLKGVDATTNALNASVSLLKPALIDAVDDKIRQSGVLWSILRGADRGLTSDVATTSTRDRTMNEEYDVLTAQVNSGSNSSKMVEDITDGAGGKAGEIAVVVGQIAGIGVTVGTVLALASAAI